MWGWKQTRDAFAAAKGARLARAFHAWRSLAAAARQGAAPAVSPVPDSARPEAEHDSEDQSGQSSSAQARRALQAWHAVAGVQEAGVKAFRRASHAAALMTAMRAWRRAAQWEQDCQFMAKAANRIRTERAFRAWRAECLQAHSVAALQRRHAASLAESALHAWRARAAHAARMRSKAALIATRRAASLQQSALQAIRAHAVSCRESCVAAAMLIQARSQRLMAASLLAWKAQVLAAMERTAKVDLLAAEWCHRGLLTAWQVWKAALRAAAARAKAAEQRAAQREELLIGDAFFAWRRCTQGMQRRRAATLLQCLDSMACTRQQRALHVWHSKAQRSRAALQQAVVLCQARQVELLSSMLASWHAAATTAAQARERAGLALQLRVQGTAVRRALTAWRDKAHAARVARQQAEGMAQARQAGVIRRVLAGWLDESALMGGMRHAAIRIMQARQSMKMLRNSFLAWQYCCGMLRMASLAADARGNEREEALLQSMLQAWQHAAEQQRSAQEGLLQQFQAASQRRLLASALRCWQALHSARQAARVEAMARHQTLEAVSLHAAFLVWRLVGASMADTRQLSWQRAARAFSQRRLRAVLRAWGSSCRAARKAAQGRAAHAQKQRAQHAFSAWRIANASLAHQRSSLLSLCTELARERRLSAVFAAWRRTVLSGQQRVAEAVASAAQHDSRVLRQAFAAWRIANAALAHERHSSAEGMSAARLQHVQHASFLAWRQHAGDIRAARFAAAAMGDAAQRQIASELLMRVLEAWMSHTRNVVEKKRSGAALTRYICRYDHAFVLT